jgi:DNA-directed RNA polymerase subunit M/transcription elongation factor TFIIS
MLGIAQNRSQRMTDLPEHEPQYREAVMLTCPKCGEEEPCGWDALEPGTLHVCPACNYKWRMASTSTNVLIPMGNIVGEPLENETENFVTCNICGQAYDRRDAELFMYHFQPNHAPRETDS